MFVKSDNNPLVFSYIEPHDYETMQRKTIKTLDFEKMNERNNLMVTNNHGPAVATYNPKYNSIFPDSLRK